MLYPHSFGEDPLYPKSTDFAVVRKDDTNGYGVITYRSFKAGELLARVAGEIVPEVRQHTLQISRKEHLYDTYFTGYLLHSCAPNVSLDMKKFTLTALTDIPANSYLYMDYAETEDTLYKQFVCSCGAPECRGVITGRKEAPYIHLMEAGREADQLQMAQS